MILCFLDGETVGIVVDGRMIAVPEAVPAATAAPANDSGPDHLPPADVTLVLPSQTQRVSDSAGELVAACSGSPA
jgi:hypothetical protein